MIIQDIGEQIHITNVGKTIMKVHFYRSSLQKVWYIVISVSISVSDCSKGGNCILLWVSHIS